MASDSIITVTCNGCSGVFRVKRPERSGVYPINCPRCGKGMRVPFTGYDKIAVPSTDLSGATPDNSTARPLPYPKTLIIGETYPITCPHCKQKRWKFTPDEIKNALKCPLCKGRFWANAKASVDSPTDTLTDIRMSDKDTKTPTAILMVKLPTGHIAEYPLPEGKQVIGRADNTRPSDINIQGDGTMSRRSISLQRCKSKVPRWKLTVHAAVNPVKVNGEAVDVGESIYVHPQETIALGSSLLTIRIDR